MNSNYTHFYNSLDTMFDNIQKHKNEVMEDFRKDKDEKMVSLNTQKLNILDTLLKNIVKYRNTSNKEKEILEKQKFKNLLGKSKPI
jgi:hypothetical protein